MDSNQHNPVCGRGAVLAIITIRTVCPHRKDRLKTVRTVKFRNSLVEKSYKIHNTVERIEVVTVRAVYGNTPQGTRLARFAAWILFSRYAKMAVLTARYLPHVREVHEEQRFVKIVDYINVV